VAVIVPFPDPEGVTVHQDWLLEAVQVVLEVTVNEVFPAAGVTGRSDGVTESVGGIPACVTITTTGVNPVTVTVIFATREETNVFAV